MKHFSKKRSSLVKLGLACLLVGMIYLSTQANQSVLAQLNRNFSPDINSLKARITRLEQNVNQLRTGNVRLRNLNKVPAAPPQPQQLPRRSTGNPPIIDNRAIGASDPLFERLSTLLIELKEDMRNIEQRLTRIEQNAA